MRMPRLSAGMVAVLLACWVVSSWGPTASAQRERRPGERVKPPTELLREYPFEQGRLRSRQRSGRQRSGARSADAPAPAPAAEEGGGGWPVIWLVLGAVGLSAATMLLALGLVRRRPRPGPRRRRAGTAAWRLRAWRRAGIAASRLRAWRRTGRPRPGGYYRRLRYARGKPSKPRDTLFELAIGQLTPPQARPPNPPSAPPAARFPRTAGPVRAANSYAVANQKGGVGKTTISLVLGAAAARRGKRVLLVDLDPQASATSVLRAEVDKRPTLADVMVDRSCALHDAVVETSWGIDLVPAEHRLRAAETGEPTRLQSVLRRELAAVSAYDLTLVDCPPSLGVLTVEALAATSGALVVTEPSYLALHSMEELRDTLQSVADEQNPTLELAGMVINRVESTAEHRRSVAELEATFGPRVWEPHVPKRAILQDAMRLGTPPQELTTHSHYANEIAEIFDRLVERFEAVEVRS